ncbi:hypothetical protein XA68_14302 [Ophiocordyceps unilateralis]|uniref:Nudix hydrolase domain-containing protein n=1 Tax=Ophiocordyceps unilateralis TaxID=268505 RepID=A0A2A9PAR4_OPHUN|nr:hypothetical protein XA68_14302 [Ophiocordyceps unilateralis]
MAVACMTSCWDKTVGLGDADTITWRRASHLDPSRVKCEYVDVVDADETASTPSKMTPIASFTPAATFRLKSSTPSFYEVIRRCNKFDRDLGGLWEFCLLDNLRPVGYMLPESVASIMWEGTGFHVFKAERRVHLMVDMGRGGDVVDVCRDEFVDLCEKNVGVVGGLGKWLGNKADYHPIRGLDSHLTGLQMPSPLRGVFGIVTSGVHMNLYTMKVVNGRPKMHVWVSRRSDKVTYAGKLDQVVAGAMDPGDAMDPLRTLQREAMEEARLAVEMASRRVTADGIVVGTVEHGPRITFYDRKDPTAGCERGQLEPGIRFTFDLEVDASFRPRPGEPEAATDFVLKAVDEVKRDLMCSEWKPNCGLVMLDFLLRKGQIRPEDDERYGLLKQGLQRELPFVIV